MKCLNSLFWFILGSVVCLFFIESVLRILPVETGIGKTPLERFSPVLGGAPGKQFNFCRDWNFSMLNRKKINSDGFACSYDYPSSDTQKGVIPVIGDSFIEALMVPAGETIQERLNLALPEKNVVGLGLSSAGLATYLYLFEQSTKLWEVDTVIFMINDNDLLESLTKRPGLASFEVTKEGVELKLPQSFIPDSSLKGKLKDVRLLRYIVGQLKLWPSRALSAFKERELNSPLLRIASNVEGQTLPIEIKKKLLTHFFNKVGNLKKKKNIRVVFVVNFALSDPYALLATKEMNMDTALIVDEAKRQGFDVYDAYHDLHLMHKRTGKRPRWLNDGHLTPAGHQVVADGVYKLLE